MIDERVKFEGRLALNRQDRVQASLRLQGLVKSLRAMLDPTLPVERLEGELIADMALQLGTLALTYRELLAESQKIKEILGK